MFFCHYIYIFIVKIKTRENRTTTWPIVFKTREFDFYLPIGQQQVTLLKTSIWQRAFILNYMANYLEQSGRRKYILFSLHSGVVTLNTLIYYWHYKIILLLKVFYLRKLITCAHKVLVANKYFNIFPENGGFPKLFQNMKIGFRCGPSKESGLLLYLMKRNFC